MSTPLLKLERNGLGQLVLTLVDGSVYTGIVPVRAYPITAPLEGLSLFSADGHEVAWIERMDQVPPSMRALLEEDLALREFTPVIRAILDVSSFSTPSTWTVDTDRGPTRFVLKTEDDIRRLGQGRLLINSTQGLHFAVPNSAALDKASRKLLERFL